MNISIEQIKQYREEGASGIKKAMLEDNLINFMLEGETNKEYIQAIISLAAIMNSEINARIKSLGTDLALEAITEEFAKKEEVRRKKE